MKPHQEISDDRATPTEGQPDSSPVDNRQEDLSHIVRRESVGLLYGQIDKGLLSILISAGVLAFVESSVVDYTAAAGWLGAIITVSALHYMLLLAFRNSQSRERRTLFWRNLFVACTIGSGIIWSSSSLLLFAPESIAHQTFLAFILVGISAGTTTVLAPSLTTVVVFLSITLLPISVQFFLQGSEIQIAMGGMIIVFFLLLLSAAWWAHGTVRTSLTLRHENTHLIEYLACAKDRAEHANERLHSYIQERKQIEQQLKKAKEEAERASRSKGDFLSTISHEIRTPMNGVLGTLELVGEMPLGKEQRDLVATAYHSAESLITIINAVLDFSKIEIGRLQLEDIDFDPRRLVSEVTALLGKRGKAKGLKIACEISSKIPGTLRGDPTRLRQILSNLIGNAVKFTERGRILVRTEVVRNTPASVLLRFEVEDTGIGMSPTAQADLFQPFTQADGSMVRKFGGTGLGLSISKQLIDLMGGKIGIQSEKGQGSTFWFTVYLAKPARVDRRHRKDLSRTQLLVLMDNQELKARLSTDFSRWGASFEFTTTGAETMAKLKSSAMIGDTWTYDAVIMDAESKPAELLPLISGIRSNSSLTGTVLVVIGKRPGELEAVEEVADACLAPPLKAQALFDALASSVEEPAFPGIFDTGARADDDQAETLLLEEPELAPNAVPAPEKPAQERFHGHLLLAEDNPVNQKVAKNVVERLGLSVDLANDGKQAVEAVVNGTYDVVLMDCQMPAMDGFQATRAIRRIEKSQNLKRVPIIAVTANAMEGDREHCLEVGMDDYLAKPFKQRILRDLLARWLPEEATGRPVVAALDRSGAVAKQALQADTTPSRAQAEGCILVAEDNQVNLGLTRAMLEQLEYGVDVVSNGREVIAAVKQRRYGAILMDCEMPDVDGFEATREIRRIEQQKNTSHTPLVGLTRHTEKSDHERYLQAGMDAVLTKPIQRDRLAQTLSECLSGLQASMEIDLMSEKNSATGPTLDKRTLEELKDIMEDEFDDLVQTFIKDAPTHIYKIRDGIQAHDTKAVWYAAHALKSSSANLGALQLPVLAKELEMLAKAGRLSGAVELLKQIAEEFKRVRNELRAL